MLNRIDNNSNVNGNNELDQFVKQRLRVKYYVRYVDDFVILDISKDLLQRYEEKISLFLREKLLLELHLDKSKILPLCRGIGFLGLRIFPFHKRIKKKNIRRFDKKLQRLHKFYQKGYVEREKVVEHFEGWLSYISHANTFKYQKHMVQRFNQLFPINNPIQTHHLAKHQNFMRKTEEASLQFSVQKTLQLFKKGMSIANIAQERQIRAGTELRTFSIMFSGIKKCIACENAISIRSKELNAPKSLINW